MLRKIIVFSAIASASTASALPSILAFEAAQAAVDSCARQGFHVTATVVDDHGLNVALLRGDGATPHTLDSSRGKAYTVVTFGPIVNIWKTSEIAARVLASPETSQLANVPGLLFLSGAVAIRNERGLFGGIGVGGAPGGKLDEECAQAGVDKINDKL